MTADQAEHGLVPVIKDLDRFGRMAREIDTGHGIDLGQQLRLVRNVVRHIHIDDAPECRPILLRSFPNFSSIGPRT